MSVIDRSRWGRGAWLAAMLAALARTDAAEGGTEFTPGPWSRTRPTVSDPSFQISAALASDDPRYSRVIIETRDGRQITYGVGDSVMPGVVIDTIERDYVVLDRGGRAEVIRLRAGSALPTNITLNRPEPTRPRGSDLPRTSPGQFVDAGSTEERLARLRSGVTATPPPLPPTSTKPLDLDRRQGSAKLEPLERDDR